MVHTCEKKTEAPSSQFDNQALFLLHDLQFAAVTMGILRPLFLMRV